MPDPLAAELSPGRVRQRALLRCGRLHQFLQAALRAGIAVVRQWMNDATRPFRSLPMWLPACPGSLATAVPLEAVRCVSTRASAEVVEAARTVRYMLATL